MNCIEIRFAWFNSTCDPGPVPSCIEKTSSAELRSSLAMTPGHDTGPTVTLIWPTFE
jgi:hypothetical protein